MGPQDKSERCFVERGFDFAYAVQAFFDHNAIRIISARKANKREVKHYEDTTRDN